MGCVLDESEDLPVVSICNTFIACIFPYLDILYGFDEQRFYRSTCRACSLSDFHFHDSKILGKDLTAIILIVSYV
jgi:hypothetical protein